MGGNFARLIRKSTRICRLTATGLFFREMNPDAFALEQCDGVEAGTGKELIHDAGGEKIDV